MDTLPAGDYFVEGLWWNAVAFHHGKGEANLVVMAQQSPRTQEVKTKLIFHRYGDHYILAKAELPNTDYGRAFETGEVATHEGARRSPRSVRRSWKSLESNRRTTPIRPRHYEARIPSGFVLFQLEREDIPLLVHTIHQDLTIRRESPRIAEVVAGWLATSRCIAGSPPHPPALGAACGSRCSPVLEVDERFTLAGPQLLLNFFASDSISLASSSSMARICMGWPNNFNLDCHA